MSQSLHAPSTGETPCAIKTLSSASATAWLLLADAAADADGADDFAVLLERNAAGEDHHLTVVGNVNAVKAFAGLGELAQRLGFNIKRTACPGFLDGNVYAAHPCAVHTDERNEVSAAVHKAMSIGCPWFWALVRRP